MLENDVSYIRKARKGLDADIKMNLRLKEPDFTKMSRPRCGGDGSKGSKCGVLISANKVRCMQHQEAYLARVVTKSNQTVVDSEIDKLKMGL